MLHLQAALVVVDTYQTVVLCRKILPGGLGGTQIGQVIWRNSREPSTISWSIKMGLSRKVKKRYSTLLIYLLGMLSKGRLEF